MPKRPLFVDLKDVEENKRIDLMGDAITRLGKTIAFVTDGDEGKAERYILKLQAKFPGVVVLARFPGPIKGTVAVKLGPAPAQKDSNSTMSQ